MRSLRPMPSLRASYVIAYRDSPERRDGLEWVLAHVQQLRDVEVVLVRQESSPDWSPTVVAQASAHQALAMRHVHQPYDGPFRKAWACNAGARAAGAGTLVFGDADMWASAIDAAIDLCANGTFDAVDPYDTLVDEHGEPERRRGERLSLCGGVFAITAEALWRVGGWDERFIGWGGEDDALVPSGALGRVVSVGAVLVVLAVGAALLLVAQALVAQRTAARWDVRLSSALYQRVVRLPMSWHRSHEPGAIAQRIAGLDAVPSVLASVLPMILSAVGIAGGSLIALLVLALGIALAVVGMCALVLAVGLAVLIAQFRYARAYTDASVQLSGSVFAMLGGIAKIRVAGAESRMFGRWLFGYARQQQVARSILVRGAAVAVIAVLAAPLVVFVVIGLSIEGAMPLGTFTAITTAATQCAGAVALAIPAVGLLLRIGPTVAAIRPLVETCAEPAGSALGDPGELHGDVRGDRISTQPRSSSPRPSCRSTPRSRSSLSALLVPRAGQPWTAQGDNPAVRALAPR